MPRQLVTADECRAIIATALDALGIDPGERRDNLADLLLKTAAHESGFAYLYQVGGGPALGLWQDEPADHHDLWVNYLNYRPALAKALGTLAKGQTMSAELLANNHQYAAGIAACHYLRDEHIAPFPAMTDIEGQAGYYLRFYNSGGKATAQEFIADARRLVSVA